MIGCARISRTVNQRLRNPTCQHHGGYKFRHSIGWKKADKVTGEAKWLIMFMKSNWYDLVLTMKFLKETIPSSPREVVEYGL